MNKTVKAYSVVEAETLKQFQTLVKNSIDGGWQPFGGVSRVGMIYVQAMVQYE